jgi:hypothetical protein
MAALASAHLGLQGCYIYVMNLLHLHVINHGWMLQLQTCKQGAAAFGKTAYHSERCMMLVFFG